MKIICCMMWLIIKLKFSYSRVINYVLLLKIERKCQVLGYKFLYVSNSKSWIIISIVRKLIKLLIVFLWLC